MNTNNCAEITDMKSRGSTNGLTESGKQHQPYGFIIPVGILIGLGGVGLGFLGSGLIPLVRKPLESEGVLPGSTDVTMLLIGAFLVFIGIGTVFAPAALWWYAIAGFLILMGI